MRREINPEEIKQKNEAARLADLSNAERPKAIAMAKETLSSLYQSLSTAIDNHPEVHKYMEPRVPPNDQTQELSFSTKRDSSNGQGENLYKLCQFRDDDKKSKAITIEMATPVQNLDHTTWQNMAITIFPNGTLDYEDPEQELFYLNRAIEKVQEVLGLLG